MSYLLLILLIENGVVRCVALVWIFGGWFFSVIDLYMRRTLNKNDVWSVGHFSHHV